MEKEYIEKTQIKYLPINEKYAEDLKSVWSDEEVIKYTNIKSPCTLEAIQDRVHRFKSHEVFVVCYKEKAIGVIGCPTINEGKKEFGVFYQFQKAVWGQGLATMAAKWLIHYIEEKYGEVTLYADVVASNVASEKILKSLDFELTGIEKEGFERNAIKMDIHNYMKKCITK